MINKERLFSLLSEDKKALAQEVIDSKKEAMPLIIKIVLGLGAFASATLFFAALGAALGIVRNFILFLSLGVILIAAAVFIKNFAVPKMGSMLKFFVNQFLLVAMLFGRLCIFAGVADLPGLGDSGLMNVALAVSFLLAVLPYKFFKSAVDRFLSVFVFMLMLYVRLIIFDNYGFSYFNSIVFVSFIASSMLFILRKKTFYPAAWALVVSMIIPFFINIVIATYINTGVNAALQTPYLAVVFNNFKILIALYFGVLFFFYKRFKNEWEQKNIFIPFLVLVFILPFNLPVIYGLFYLLIGQFFKDMRIKTMAYGVLGGGIVYLYYNMDVSLLTKSLLLMFCGVLLFAVREALKEPKNAR